ncbi:aspartate/glutamate racemase family protein [Cupriavidus sp. SK-4]|uniref:aspartate/glutamate racemase family protein n=1 Tax=Cupriavidus sp. SK-4 TaxID=574750 RepID=UPI00350EB502
MRRAQPARFKLGIVGGIGPAATVDFMAKIVRNTSAAKDQDHIRLLVEQNPQIPDRTAHLLHQADDPTLALYATCRRLEAGGASAIALPCNTAHAFVERIQPYLGVPIINMLQETVDDIVRRYGAGSTVGLLATSGTVASRVYHSVAQPLLTVLTPEPDFQQRVMNAIYGPRGVKAGYTDGACRDDLLAAIDHLAARGAAVMILGCTELPLIVAQTDRHSAAGKTVAVVDPTNVLARRCIQIAQAYAVPAPPGSRRPDPFIRPATLPNP